MQYLPRFARRVPPDLYPELAKDWPTDAKKWPQWSEAIERFLAVLQFRHEMHAELTSNQPPP